MGLPRDRHDRVEDPSELIDAIASETGQSVESVAEHIRVFRDAIDDLLARGCIVATGELFLAFGDSPTRRALLTRLDDDEPVPEAVLRGDPVSVADWLDLPLAVYSENPLANLPHVMAAILDIAGHSENDLDILWDLLHAWDASFADGRIYRIGRLGLERAAESWLVDHIPRLRLHGFPVDLLHQQFVLPSGRRPDLICRYNDSADGASDDDILVVELKATRYYAGAAEQVAGYVAEISEHYGEGRTVHGLLITDGATHEDIATLRARGIAHLAFAELGYRQQLAQARHHQPSTLSTLGEPVAAQDTTDSSSPGSINRMSNGEGPEIYRVRLFWDFDGGEEEVERNAGESLWNRREARRVRYEQEWGRESAWPASHPTTLIEATGTPWDQVAVCIRCDWVCRPSDLDANSSLHDQAKEHALAHPHDPDLAAGQNPPKVVVDLEQAIHDARENARRHARRVEPTTE